MDEPAKDRTGLDRREFVGGAVLGGVGGLLAGCARPQPNKAESTASVKDKPAAASSAAARLGGPMPGPWPGRVIEVHDPRAVVNGKNDPQIVKQMFARGLCALGDAQEPTDVWRRLFQAGDVVGIKVNPVGAPHVVSSFEIVLECIEGLKSAGIKPQDILVFERYRKQFLDAGFDKIIPDGVRWECTTENYDNVQLDIDGYDPDVYLVQDYCDPKQHDLKDDRIYRSHVSLIVSRKVNKIINLPCLKDHGSGGVTLALKNMSHGFVNNVARSHGGPHYNQCGVFIPAVCNLPVIRSKVVLHVLDGLRGVYQKGPGPGNWPKDPWYYHSIFFATDPVAVDAVGWRIVDEKRVEKGLPPVAEAGRMGKPSGDDREAFDFRQPQHIPLAATLGLGVFDPAGIDHRRLAESRA